MAKVKVIVNGGRDDLHIKVVRGNAGPAPTHRLVPLEEPNWGRIFDSRLNNWFREARNLVLTSSSPREGWKKIATCPSCGMKVEMPDPEVWLTWALWYRCAHSQGAALEDGAMEELARVCQRSS